VQLAELIAVIPLPFSARGGIAYMRRSALIQSITTTEINI
jgi:hypothetical protein